MGFVGLPGADNARERIEGVKDTIKGSKVELVDVRADDIDQTRAKRNVEDTLTAHPEINCMVGYLFLQHAAHLRGAEGGRQARQDHGHRLRRGSDHARRRQGRHDRRHRRAAALRMGLSGHEGHGEVPRGRQVVHPANDLMIIPTKIIDKSNVDAFWAELKQRQGKKCADELTREPRSTSLRSALR